MKKALITPFILILGLSVSSANALILKGDKHKRESTLEVCFDEESIMTVVPNSDELELKKQWVRDALLEESWGYYTNIEFTGWESCAESPDADIKFVYDIDEENEENNGGAWSSDNRIAINFLNPNRSNFERYHITSATIHEMGHQLGFIHEQDRIDSPYYSGKGGNQKFRFTKTDGTAYTSGNGPFQIRVERQVDDGDALAPACLSSSDDEPYIITQQACSETDEKQQFTLQQDGESLNLSDWTHAPHVLTQDFDRPWANIKNVADGKCIDVRGASTDWSARLITYKCSSTANNQQIAAMKYNYTKALKNKTAGAVYGLQFRHSDLWADVLGSTAEFGNEVGQYRAFFADFDNLLTAYDKNSVMAYENDSLRSSGYILLQGDIDGAREVYGDSGKKTISESLVSKLSNKCFNYDDAATLKSTQQTCNSKSKNQQFRIVWLTQNEFRIYDPLNDKCLAANRSVLRFDNCESETNNETTENQRFTMSEGENSTWTQIESNTGTCLTVRSSSQENGAKIVLRSCSDSKPANQLFKITR